MSLAFQGENFSVDILTRDVRGVTQEFELLRRPSVVIGVPILDDGRVLLISQFRLALNRCILEFPAGKLNSGEPPEEGIKRELKEETGFCPTELHFIGSFFSAPHFSDEQISVFIAKGTIASSPQLSPMEELIDVRPLSSTALDTLIEKGEIVDAKSIVALVLARMHATRLGVIL